MFAMSKSCSVLFICSAISEKHLRMSSPRHGLSLLFPPVAAAAVSVPVALVVAPTGVAAAAGAPAAGTAGTVAGAAAPAAVAASVAAAVAGAAAAGAAAAAATVAGAGATCGLANIGTIATTAKIQTFIFSFFCVLMCVENNPDFKTSPFLQRVPVSTAASPKNDSEFCKMSSRVKYSCLSLSDVGAYFK